MIIECCIFIDSMSILWYPSISVHFAEPPEDSVNQPYSILACCFIFFPFNSIDLESVPKSRLAFHLWLKYMRSFICYSKPFYFPLIHSQETMFQILLTTYNNHILSICSILALLNALYTLYLFLTTILPVYNSINVYHMWAWRLKLLSNLDTFI